MRHSMTPTYIHKLNLGVNMSYNMRHALNTMFCLLSVSCLVAELFCSIHTTAMLTVCYINRQPGRGYHFSETNACGESAASKNHTYLINTGHIQIILIVLALLPIPSDSTNKNLFRYWNLDWNHAEAGMIFPTLK